MARNKCFIRIGFTIGLITCLHAIYMPVKAQLAQQLLLTAWFLTQSTGEAVKPWPWADTEPMARLSFTKQQTDYIVLAGSMGRTLAFAPGHLTGTALPGEQGHMVISAHRDSHFKILAEVNLGDVITLESRNGHIRNYQVIKRRIIDSRFTPLILDSSANRLTLVTCYPFDSLDAGGPLRLQIDTVQIREIL